MVKTNKFKLLLYSGLFSSAFLYMQYVLLGEIYRMPYEDSYEGLENMFEPDNLKFIRGFFPANYSMLPWKSCSNEVQVLVVVNSHIGSIGQRNIIRSAWANTKPDNMSFWISCLAHNVCTPSQIKLVFIVGTTPNKVVQRFVEEEYFQHGDIIQGHFPDTYRNLVHKSILLLDYSAKYCPNVQFLQKIDDNVELNMTLMMDILRSNPDTPEGFVLGYMFGKQKEVLRKGKWKVEHTEYSSKYFPPYVTGPSYIISHNAIAPLFKAAEMARRVYVEDVFITGICRNSTKVGIRNNSAFCYFRKRSKNLTCAIRHNT